MPTPFHTTKEIGRLTKNRDKRLTSCLLPTVILMPQLIKKLGPTRFVYVFASFLFWLLHFAQCYAIYNFCQKVLTLIKLPLLGISALAIRTLSNKTMANPDYKEAKSIYDFSANDIKGNPVSLEKYRGHVCIVVNVASQCGYAKNHYEELNDLYEKYGKSKGLRILGFPCNQFGNQEPGDDNTVCQFVQSKNVKFDMFGKVNVNGDDAHPLWKYLKSKKGGLLGTDFIKWNFTKFIVDKNGQPVERHGPSTSPKDLVKSLEKYF